MTIAYPHISHSQTHTWGLDSMTSIHITGNKYILHDIKTVNERLTTNNSMSPTHYGSTRIILENGNILHLNKVYYVPSMPFHKSIISIGTLYKRGVRTVPGNFNQIYGIAEGETFFNGTVESNGIYSLNLHHEYLQLVIDDQTDKLFTSEYENWHHIINIENLQINTRYINDQRLFNATSLPNRNDYNYVPSHLFTETEIDHLHWDADSI